MQGRKAKRCKARDNHKAGAHHKNYTRRWTLVKITLQHLCVYTRTHIHIHTQWYIHIHRCVPWSGPWPSMPAHAACAPARSWGPNPSTCHSRAEPTVSPAWSSKSTGTQSFNGPTTEEEESAGSKLVCWSTRYTEVRQIMKAWVSPAYTCDFILTQLRKVRATVL